MRVDWRCQQGSVQGLQVPLLSPHYQGKAQRGPSSAMEEPGVQRAQGESPSCNGLNQPCCLCLGSILDGYPRWTPSGFTVQCLPPGSLIPLQQQSRERLLLLQTRAFNPWHAASMLQCLHQPGNIPERCQTLLTEPFLAGRDGAGHFTADKIPL